METTRKFAIYSRKSKFTGKGESIGNQIELCRQSIHLSYPEVSDEDILVFEDEGFSGGNTKRPQFQEMLKRCRQKEIVCIVCYRLDRISRNVGDYSALIEELDRLDVSFISVSEKFDTTSSMGRAMMYIASVFAQLERETIAERIRDNMIELAKDGRWLGGNPPTGYKSVETTGSVTVDGKKRKARMLEVIPVEAELVRMIFEKFLEFRSLTKTETYLIQNNYFSKTGKRFTRFAVKNILSNPVYLIADETAWDYFELLDIDVFSDKSEFNGKHGVMAYNKTSQKVGRTNELRDIKEWVIAVGRHKGIISSGDWTEAQKLLEQNKSKSYRKPKSSVALLSGLLFCGECGSFMRPKLTQRKNRDGEFIYDYLCELKEKSKSQKCGMKRPNGNKLDKIVCEEIKKLSNDKSEFMTILKNQHKKKNVNDESYLEKVKSLRKSKTETEAKIKTLVQSLTQSEGTPAQGYILQGINVLDEMVKKLESQIAEYENLAKTDNMSEEEFQKLAEIMTSFAAAFENMSAEQKRMAIRAFVRKVIWDGENVHIYFFGADEDKIDLSDIDNGEPQGEYSK
ncbi:MAG: recombinase family protein [Oscillospiraceae bacterium]